jgi:N6-adenosine-specific RNA methylase IME4
MAPPPFETLPRRQAGAILIDPPQKYETWSPAGDGRAPDYRTLTIGELMTWPVAELAADDCWLFLWLGNLYANRLNDLMNAWGFKFSSTAFQWIKLRKLWQPGLFGEFNEADIKSGTGKTTLKCTETCWLGRRGQARRQSPVREAIIAPIREHSRKPDEQYPRIMEFCKGPYLELFARQQVPGWISWGNEADKFEFTGQRFLNPNAAA